MMTRFRAAAPILRLALAVALAWAAPADMALAQAPADVDERLPVDPRVRYGTLENGLRYYVRANARPEKRAELRLVVNAGSVLETDRQRGLAHFVEHMAFNGTRSFPKQALIDYLESVGMRFGPDLNAYTGFDETVYMLQVPTDDDEVLATGVQILEEWAHGIAFEEEEVDQERLVVIEEWRARRSASARLMDKEYPVLLRGSRYAERLPIGTVEILQSFPLEELTSFYRDWYRPDMMAVIAVGDFDADFVEAEIRRRFGAIPARADAPERPLFPVPEHDETLVQITTDPELTSTSVELYHKSPVHRLETVGDYRRMLMSRLFNRMLNARLSELTQRADPPFLGAQSGQGSFVRTSDAYYLGANVRDDGVLRGLEALTLEAERVARHGFTPSELERTKADLLRSYERAYAERERTESASHAAEYIDHFLAGVAIPGIAYEYELVQRLLPTIEVQELNGLAREWITDRNRVVLVSAPESAAPQLPGEAALREVLASVDRRDVDPYEDLVTDRPLLAEKPTPSPVVEEIAHDVIGVTEWRLANGVRVLLKPTNFKEDEVLLSGYSPGGLSLAPIEILTPARTAADVVVAGGVGEFSLTDLDKVLAGKAANVGPYIAEREEGFSGSASPQDLETMFQLLYLYFTAPRRDEEAFQAMIERTRPSLANRSANPGTVFGDTLNLTLAQYHPRVRVADVSMLDEMDLDRSLAFYRERFADASDFTFVLVGTLDLANVRPLVETYLGGLPSTGRQETWVDHGIRPPMGVIEKVVRRGIEPRSQTQIVFTGPFTTRIEDNYAIQSLSEVLDMRLMEVLREELGGTYSVGVSASTTVYPEPLYTFAIGFSAAPERLDELAEAVFEQIRRIQEQGPTAEEIEKVREIQRRAREANLQQNGYWLGQIAAYRREGRDFSLIPAYDRRVESLSVEMVRDAARRWLRLDNYVRVSLHPSETP